MSLCQPDQHERTTERAVTPLIGVVAIVGITVVLSVSVGLLAGGAVDSLDEIEATSESLLGGPSGMEFSVTGQTLTLTPTGGEPIDVRSLTLVVHVDGDPLDSQPPVPFFSAAGFQPGPSGAFNSAASGPWEVGQPASVTLAGTNSPAIKPGSTVSVRLYDENALLLTVETTAR